ncbi:MAG: septum formation inhibitor Maf [Eubacterium sp.]|nr:septum formation inhibitor Maf [Eubacterium sp.]
MLILASKSPRRSELLTLAGLRFEVVPAVGEEFLPESITPSEAVLMLSRQKAAEVSEKFPTDTVIGADTVVAVDGRILGKPKDEQDAYNMLRLLSGNTHSVYTGVCIRRGEREMPFYQKTDVEFYALSDSEIYDYIATGEPMDKAGAYGIQEKGFFMVKGIHGDYYNVVGLPIAETVRKLKELNQNL